MQSGTAALHALIGTQERRVVMDAISYSEVISAGDEDVPHYTALHLVSDTWRWRVVEIIISFRTIMNSCEEGRQ